MMKKFFYGNEVSEYGQKYGLVDYGTFAKAFSHVLNNEIVKHGYWEPVSGFEDEEEQNEVFQWFIVDENAVDLLQEANEVCLYNEEFDMYLWGVNHFGTSWDYVLTSIKC